MDEHGFDGFSRIRSVLIRRIRVHPCPMETLKMTRSEDIPEVIPVDVQPKEPPAGRKFPCRECGARLDFDPASRALQCPYCGHKEVIEPSSKKVEEHDWDEYWKGHRSKETLLTGRSSQVTCTGCGAVVLLEDKVQTDKCPYCATHLENAPKSAESMIAPEGVLPFKVTERDAVEA